MPRKTKTDFATWMTIMGFNGKQVSAAAATIGIASSNVASLTYRGERELSKAERLAMSAVRAGLPEWTPQTDQEVADIKSLREILERAQNRSQS